MANSAQEIADAIYKHLNGNSEYGKFYIGITNDIERRLFNEHSVSKDNDWWIYLEATSKTSAQKVEEHFLNKGMQGDTGGGNDYSVYVYCYRVTNKTIE